MLATSSGRNGPRRSIRDSGSPSTYSMTIRTPSSSVAVSNTETRFGWLREAPSLASRVKRCSTSTGLSAWSRFTATSRARRSSSHRSTDAMPPEPRCLITR